MTDTRTITLIDDHPLLAAALRADLERSGAYVMVLDPTIGRDRLVDAVAEQQPDCVVVDLGMPIPGGGASLIGPMVANDHRVLVLTGETETRLLARSSAAGAEAVLSKAEPLNEIVDTILQVAGGQRVRAAQKTELAEEFRRVVAEQEAREAPFTELTPREQQVLAGLMDGQAPAVLAEQNYVSVATIRTQIKNLLGKLGVSSQLQAVAMANRSHWQLPDEDG
ncbi:MAG: response regulator transcription factor [Actinomycetota bacterium]